MEYFTKENPATNGAHSEILLLDNNTQKLKKGQTRNAFVIEVAILSDDPKNPNVTMVITGKPARSLWLLYNCKNGLSRAEALEKYSILSITQHVSKMRHKWDLEILTERVQPTRYAIYHLITPVFIRLLNREGQ